MITSRSPEGSFAVSGSHEDGTLVVRLVGELDVATAPDVAEFVQLEVSAVQPQHLVVDVAEVGFVDSSGLAALLAVRRGVPDGVLVVRRASPQLRRLLAITGVGDVLVLEEDDPPPDLDGDGSA